MKRLDKLEELIKQDWNTDQLIQEKNIEIMYSMRSEKYFSGLDRNDLEQNIRYNLPLVPSLKKNLSVLVFSKKCPYRKIMLIGLDKDGNLV